MFVTYPVSTNTNRNARPQRSMSAGIALLFAGISILFFIRHFTTSPYSSRAYAVMLNSVSTHYNGCGPIHLHWKCMN